MNSDLEDMSDSEIAEIWNSIIMRKPRRIRERPCYFRYFNSREFRDRFRMSKEVVWNIILIIKESIEHKTTWYSRGNKPNCNY